MLIILSIFGNLNAQTGANPNEKIWVSKLTIKFKDKSSVPDLSKLNTVDALSLKLEKIHRIISKFDKKTKLYKYYDNSKAKIKDSKDKEKVEKILNEREKFIKVKFDKRIDYLEIEKQLETIPEIEYVDPPIYIEPLEYYPNDYDSSTLWHLNKIKAPKAWDYSKGSDIIVAIIDAGVDYHDDLADNIIYRDGTQVFVNGHGTRVASVVAAVTDNNMGIASLGFHTKIKSLNCYLSNGNLDFSYLPAKIDNAVLNPHGAKIVNMSFQTLIMKDIDGDGWDDGVGYYDFQQLHDKITHYSDEVVFIAGAGNLPVITDTQTSPVYPAYYDEVIGVGATDAEDKSASEELGWQYGSQEVTAPGFGIKVLKGRHDYPSANGTSFSSPLVCAFASLIWSYNQNLNVQEVKSLILSSTVDLGAPGTDRYFGYGRIDVSKVFTVVETPHLTITAINGQYPVLNWNHTVGVKGFHIFGKVNSGPWFEEGYTTSATWTDHVFVVQPWSWDRKYYKIYAENYIGVQSPFSNIVQARVRIELDQSESDIANIPFKEKEFKIIGNYPNPFNPNTLISYFLPAKSWCESKHL